jgi:putative transposase
MGTGDIKRRKRIRLPGYDYSRVGHYFVTAHIHDHAPWFGRVVGGKMVMNGRGEIVLRCWNEIPGHFSGVQTDGFIVMPDHVHGILIIGDNVGDGHARPLLADTDTVTGKTWRCHEKLPVVMGSFKSAVTKRIHLSDGSGRFRWQRSYHDHIIRDDADLARIREYIGNNPVNWASDEENSDVTDR